jgi:hypothetical protein
MEGVAKPSTTSSGSGVTDGPSSAAASTEERFADLCKVRVRLRGFVGKGFFDLSLGAGIVFFSTAQGVIFFSSGDAFEPLRVCLLRETNHRRLKIWADFLVWSLIWAGSGALLWFCFVYFEGGNVSSFLAVVRSLGFSALVPLTFRLSQPISRPFNLSNFILKIKETIPSQYFRFPCDVWKFMFSTFRCQHFAFYWGIFFLKKISVADPSKSNK